MPQAVAAALGVPEPPARPVLATLADALRPKRLLLVLDNCEHLLDACARLADALLRACPHLRFWPPAARRWGSPASAPGQCRRSPCRRPATEGGRPGAASALARAEAVRTVRRPGAGGRPGFALTDRNAAAVAQVCARLDGIPLALELAAARVRALPVEHLLARLDDRFRLLTGGSRTALPRHQTLRAAVDWSYDLLAESERALFARLAVFAGGFDAGGGGGRGRRWRRWRRCGQDGPAAARCWIC